MYVKTASKAHYFGLQSIDQRLSHLLKSTFRGNKNEFIMINNLAKNWEEIVGKKQAKFCYPKQIKFDKSEKIAKLTIATFNAAIGFFMENNSEIILEKIAALYGFKSITKIIVKQEPRDIGSAETTEINISEDQAKFLEKKTSEIENKDLAATVQKLGREILHQKSSIHRTN